MLLNQPETSRSHINVHVASSTHSAWYQPLVAYPM